MCLPLCQSRVDCMAGADFPVRVGGERFMVDWEHRFRKLPLLLWFLRRQWWEHQLERHKGIYWMCTEALLFLQHSAMVTQ